MREKRRFPTAAASRPALRRATVLVTVVLLALALALALRWALDTTAAAPTGNLTCSVKASCDAEEVEVFRMSFTSNAHAGTPAGSAYGYSVCCGGVTGLGTDCSGVYDTVLALSGSDNAHAATTAGGAYTTEVCLSVADGTADCTHGPDCGDYECVATVSGASNAHVADCDGTDDYATKVCCQVEAGPDCTPGVDTDGDGFDNDVECYLPTDPADDCPDWVGTAGLCPGPSCDGDDAWPLDINVDRVITASFDVLPYRGRLQAEPGDPNWLQRLDLNMDGVITASFDVLPFRGMLQQTCT